MSSTEYENIIYIKVNDYRFETLSSQILEVSRFLLVENPAGERL